MYCVVLIFIIIYIYIVILMLVCSKIVIFIVLLTYCKSNKLKITTIKLLLFFLHAAV